jgi:tetratricopeptide (TPR) repeat protein
MIALSNSLRFLQGAAFLVVAIAIIFWLFWRALQKSADPGGLAFKLALTGCVLLAAFFSIDKMAGGGDAMGQVLGVLVSLVYGLTLAFIWVPVIIDKVSGWFGSLWTGGSEPPPPEPFYSVAEARVKRGQYREAIYEIQQQLEKFPTDVTGHMKLAEIQAVRLADLPAASLTIERLLSQPGHTPPHIAYALNTLSDWHLKLHDTEAARGCLERIIQLLPDTEQAKGAQQRLAHVASNATLLAAHERSPIHLHQGPKDLGLTQGPPTLPANQPAPEDTARELVDHLERYPHDNEAREKLALLYAEHYQRVDLAMNQLEELIAAPNQPGKEVARWLNLVADLQVKHGHGFEAAQATLQRIIDRFAGLGAAEVAQQRLERLRLEFKGQQQSQVIKLGSYEKDLGLKQARRDSKPPAH